MKIALIYTPTFPAINWTTIKAQERNVGVIPPLSLAYVASTIEKAGHEVTIIDSVLHNYSTKDVFEVLRKFSPDLLGFTITTYMFHQVLEWIKILKEETGLPIVVGGQHLSMYPHETMTHKEIDYAVIGESERTLPELLDALKDNINLCSIPGISFRTSDNEVKITPSRELVADLDSLPFPARHLLDNSKYYNILTKRKNFTAAVTTRGCPYRCIFCDLKKDQFRSRTAKNIADEFQQCQEHFNIREIDIYDSSFTANRKRVLDFCDELINRQLDISWSCRTRVDCVNDQMLESMARAGCIRVMYGIESGVPEILKNLKKDVSIDKIRKIIDKTKDVGLEAFGFFMIGAPGDTHDTVKRTIDFSLELNLDSVQFTKTTPFPSTELYDYLLEDYPEHEDYWRNFVLDPSVERELPMIRTDITSDQARKYVNDAYLRFYMRPKIILRSLRKIRSLTDLLKSVRAAIDMIASRLSTQ